jgi:outer membrane protein TolC
MFETNVLLGGAMSKCLILLYCLVLSLIPLNRVCAEEFQLNESNLKILMAKGAPQIDQIQAAFLGTNVQNGQLQEQFAPELFGRANYSETNEKPIIQFFPIWSPLRQAQVGVRQNLKQGLSAEAAIGTDQRSAVSVSGKYRDITTTSISFSMQMDVWKDLFGRISKAKLESASYESQRADLERDIQMKTFLISLRRIYWSLVANKEAVKISEELLKTSKQQLAESKNRLKNSVAEADEVARNEAQVSSREANLIYLTFQKESFLKQLRTLLPELSGSEIQLADYDLPMTLDQVSVCTATIAREEKTPYQYTQYDEATSLIRKIKSQAATMNSRYSDPDVKLYGLVKATGVGSDNTKAAYYRGSYGAAVDDLQSTNRTGYEVGLRVTVPLGDSKAATQQTKELYDEKRLLAAINASDAQVINTHQQLVKNITLLNEVIRSQKFTTAQLEKRLVFMRRKYEQARVSINDLILDQDALLRSELTTIETQLQVLNLLFDYLAIYTETPCAFNRI